MNKLKSLTQFLFPWFFRGIGVNMITEWKKDSNGVLHIRQKFYRIDTFILHYFRTALKSFSKLGDIKLVSVKPVFVSNSLNLASRGFYLSIAYDSATSGTAGGTSTITISHTITGSNVFLSGHQMGQGNTTTSSMTWNTSESLTSAIASGSTVEAQLWYRAAPTTGTHNLVINLSGNGAHCGAAMSLTGVAQSSPIGTTGAASGTGTSASKAITTASANSFIIDSLGIDSGGTTQNPSTSGTNQTERLDFAANSFNQGATSTMTTTTAGSYTPGWTWASSKDYGYVVAEVKEATASGPANVKTVDGLEKASVKTVNGLAIASIKTIDGLN